MPPVSDVQLFLLVQKVSLSRGLPSEPSQSLYQAFSPAPIPTCNPTSHTEIGDNFDFDDSLQITPNNSPVLDVLFAKSDYGETGTIPLWALSQTSEASSMFEIEQSCFDSTCLDTSDITYSNGIMDRASRTPSNNSSSTKSILAPCCKIIRTGAQDLYSIPAPILASNELEAIDMASKGHKPGKHGYSIHSCAPPPDQKFLRDLYYALKGLEFDQRDRGAGDAASAPTPPCSPELGPPDDLAPRLYVERSESIGIDRCCNSRLSILGFSSLGLSHSMEVDSPAMAQVLPGILAQNTSHARQDNTGIRETDMLIADLHLALEHVARHQQMEASWFRSAHNLGFGISDTWITFSGVVKTGIVASCLLGCPVGFWLSHV